MRHVFGFLLGVVLAPAIVVVSGWAVGRVSEIVGFGGDFLSFLGLSTVAVLGAMALVVGVCVAVARISALAPGLPGLVLLAWSGVYVARPELAAAVVPGVDWGEGAVRLLTLGLYVPAGVVLFLPLLMPSRWRRVRPAGAEDDEEHFEDLAEDGYAGAEPPARRPLEPEGDQGVMGGRHARGPQGPAPAPSPYRR